MNNEYIIEFKNITKSYSEKTVLKNFSAGVEREDIVVISGPSGIGKTTLIRILLGLEKADSGDLFVNPNLRFSVVFPEDRLFSHLNVLKNVNLISKNEKLSRDVLKKVKLDDSKDLFPDELSTGMKRRVSIARALTVDFDVLVLDEPFKGLDHALAKDILNYILEISAEKTIIVVTHQKELFANHEKTKFITL